MESKLDGFKSAKIEAGNANPIYLLRVNQQHEIETDSRRVKDRLVEEMRAKGNTVDVRNLSPVMASKKREATNGD
jgi:hypothetical protein